MFDVSIVGIWWLRPCIEAFLLELIKFTAYYRGEVSDEGWILEVGFISRAEVFGNMFGISGGGAIEDVKWGW